MKTINYKEKLSRLKLEIYNDHKGRIDGNPIISFAKEGKLTIAMITIATSCSKTEDGGLAHTYKTYMEIAIKHSNDPQHKSFGRFLALRRAFRVLIGRDRADKVNRIVNHNDVPFKWKENKLVRRYSLLHKAQEE